MTAVSPGTAVTSANPNTTTNTSLSVTLASTTPGDVNVIQLSGLASGTGVNPTVTTPAGWTKLFEQMSNSGTPSSFAAVYFRTYQAGDGTARVFSWANAGQMLAICTPVSGADLGNPIPYSASIPHASGAGSTYTITGTTGADPGLLVYGAANKTGTAWSGLSDNANGQVGLSSSATMVSRVTAAELTGGTAFSKTMTGSASTIGVQWAFVLKGLTSVTTTRGTTWNVSSGSTLTSVTATRATTWGVAGPVTASRGTTWAARSRLSEWLAVTPLYVAHRGGDNDWVEMTRDAYTHAIANGCTAINIDAVRCSTGEFVASHDTTTGRVFGTNLTIGTTSWSALSGLTTTTGGFPIEKVVDLLAAFPNVVVFVENKGNTSDDAALLDMLDAAGGAGRIVIKQYYTAATVATDAHARGYTTWGYYYAADLTNLSATQARWDLLGLDYLDTSTADWTTIKAVGKPVLGHVIPSAAGAAQAFSLGADGIMTGKVLGVVPGSLASVTASRSTTWTAQAGTTAIRATNWTSAATVTSSRSTTWLAAGNVTSTRAASWNTRAVVIAGQGTSWTVNASVTASRSITWTTTAGVTQARSATWAILAAVSVARPTTWTTASLVTASRATSWNTAGSLITVTATRSTTWSTAAAVTAARSSTWTARAVVTSNRATVWLTSGAVTGQRSTNWATRATIPAVARLATWNTYRLVTDARVTTWEVQEHNPGDVIATSSASQPLLVRASTQPLASAALSTSQKIRAVVTSE